MTVEEELAELRRKLAARENVPGYASNRRALQERIAELEAG